MLVTEVERVEDGRGPTVPSWEYLTLGEVLQEGAFMSVGSYWAAVDR